MKLIATEKAPAAVGPYSQAIDCGDTVYLSGQIPLDPSTGVLVEGGIETQARRMFENIGAVLEKAGLSFKNVVKTTVFLTDIGDFAALNKVYGEYFSEQYPARICVEVSNLPKVDNAECECIARR
ncbi:MAG: RidA family protein [Oscillospiraceae bacterium]|nr:RidA family protein [Oscillospiraceae bacterium]